MRILLTGASGEIGTPLVDRLLEGGHELVVISRRSRAVEAGRRLRWVRADVRDRASLERACESEPEVVVHMAALTHSTRPAAYEAVNVTGTRNLLAAVSRRPLRRFVHMSTRAIGPGGAYAASKAGAEGAVRASGLPWTLLRPAEVYGSGGSDPILSLAADLRRRGFVPILGDGSYRLAPVYAGDLVDAVARAIEQDVGRDTTYVLAGPESMTYLELVARLEALQGLPRRRRIRVPVVAARVAIRLLSTFGLGGYVPDQVPRLLLEKAHDSSVARRELGFAPRRLEAVLPALLADEPQR